MTISEDLDDCHDLRALEEALRVAASQELVAVLKLSQMLPQEGEAEQGATFGLLRYSERPAALNCGLVDHQKLAACRQQGTTLPRRADFYALQLAGFHRVEAGFGDDEVHWDVVRLRIDR